MTLLAAPKPLVSAALTRVSRDEAGTTSPEQQWERAQQVTEVKGRPVLIQAEYREKQSASRFGKKPREKFAALIEDVRAGKYDLVILWEADRGARETEIWSRFLNVCRSTGTLIYIITHRHTYDVRIGRDWKGLMEDGVSAAYYSEQLSVNVRRGHAGSASQGKPHGNVPFGYTRVYDPARKDLAKVDGVWQQVPNEDAPTVVEVITRVAAQVPINQVARELDMPRHRVRQIALNPAYACLRTTSDGGTVKGKWVPIVTEELWRRAKAVIDGQRSGSLPGATIYLLSNVMTCATHPGTTVKGRPASANRPSGYACPECGVKVHQEQADQHVTALAIGRLAQPDAAAFLITDTSNEAEAARLDVRRLEDKLRRAQDALEAAATEDDEDMEREQIRRLKPRLKAAKERAEKLSTPPALEGWTDALGHLDEVIDRWEAASLPARKAVLRVVFERLELHRADFRGQPASERITHRFVG